jgi:restriction endonuclease S subunit
MEAVGEYGGLNLEASIALGDASNYTEFQDGDVVVAKITPCFENGKGALAEGLLNGAAYGTSELQVLRTGSRIERRFLFYLTISHSYRAAGEAGMYGASGQKRVPTEFNKDFRVPLPPLPEQTTIANFLDAQTARIDTLVGKKRELIAKLGEKRVALISRTVTRGLPTEAARAAGFDPHPRLKPSGIEWLGEVPEHWFVKRLKFVLAEPLKYGANETAEFDDPDEPRYIRITDVDDTGSLRSETFRSLPREVARPYLLREGDLLFARSGATVGKAFLYEAAWGTCAYAGYLIRARLDTDQATPAFVRFFADSEGYWQWVSSVHIQATIQNVSAEKYADLFLPVPPVSEQLRIVRYLDAEVRKIQDMISRVEAAIERLQEYRSALVTASVTGKVDVRDALTSIETETPEAVA